MHKQAILANEAAATAMSKPPQQQRQQQRKQQQPNRRSHQPCVTNISQAASLPYTPTITPSLTRALRHVSVSCFLTILALIALSGTTTAFCETQPLFREQEKTLSNHDARSNGEAGEILRVEESVSKNRERVKMLSGVNEDGGGNKSTAANGPCLLANSNPYPLWRELPRHDTCARGFYCPRVLSGNESTYAVVCPPTQQCLLDRLSFSFCEAQGMSFTS